MNDKQFEIKYNINNKTGEIAAYYDTFQSIIADVLTEEVCNIIARNHGLYLEPMIVCRAVEKQRENGALHMFGVAHLHPEDVYDENEGKKIARRRLRSRYRAVRNEILRACWRQIKYSFEVMQNNIGKCIKI